MFQFVSSIQIYKQVKGEMFPKFYFCVNLRLIVLEIRIRITIQWKLLEY